MSLCTITNIDVLNNPAKLVSDLQFNITFEVLAELKEDIEFKIIYVGSANNELHDQVLESIMVGPVPVGVNQFVFQAEGPKPEKIPHDDVIGVTVVLITCSYLGREFIRIGYYVNNEYDDPELTENPPSTHDFNRIFRNILADKPRVTKFRIPWDNEPTAQEEAAMAMEAQKAMQMEAAATGAGMGLNMQLQQSSSTDMAME